MKYSELLTFAKAQRMILYSFEYCLIPLILNPFHHSSKSFIFKTYKIHPALKESCIPQIDGIVTGRFPVVDNIADFLTCQIIDVNGIISIPDY